MRMVSLSSAPRKSGGFTLVEILLAFVVFTLSFAVVLEIVAGSTRSTARAREYSEAALLAQSLVELVGNEFPLEVATWEGEGQGGYRWTIDIYEYDTPEEDFRVIELAELNATYLFWVDIRVEWGQEGREREAVFSTIKSILESARSEQ